MGPARPPHRHLHRGLRRRHHRRRHRPGRRRRVHGRHGRPHGPHLRLHAPAGRARQPVVPGRLPGHRRGPDRHRRHRRPRRRPRLLGRLRDRRPRITDFNCDGVEDIAIADPRATVGGDANAGLVRIVYGGGKGTAEITQDLDWVPGGSEANDYFAEAIDTTDFNEDGCTDLVVGTPARTCRAPPTRAWSTSSTAPPAAWAPARRRPPTTSRAPAAAPRRLRVREG